MRKKYIKPTTKVFEIKPATLLVGSAPGPGDQGDPSINLAPTLFGKFM